MEEPGPNPIYCDAFMACIVSGGREEVQDGEYLSPRFPTSVGSGHAELTSFPERDEAMREAENDDTTETDSDIESVKAEVIRLREENSLFNTTATMLGHINTTANLMNRTMLSHRHTSHVTFSMTNDAMISAWNRLVWQAPEQLDPKWITFWASRLPLGDLLKLNSAIRRRLREQVIMWSSSNSEEKQRLEVQMITVLQRRRQVRLRLTAERPDFLAMFYESSISPSPILARERREVQRKICQKISLHDKEREMLRKVYVRYKDDLRKLGEELEAQRAEQGAIFAAFPVEEQRLSFNAQEKAKSFLALKSAVDAMQVMHIRKVMDLYFELIESVEKIMGWRKMTAFYIGMPLPMMANFCEVCAELI